ncbi:MAG: bifunctional folylpolyglutamate synthase/dihydrofolate synthase [Dehalococcoidia bacterium]|nr:MAG: bifunctional folylpolyglutamate synthase/dihydrofolate synthase [Dehalococcoidia bacterium]
MSAGEREALAWLFSFADQERGVGWNPAASPAEQWKLGRTRALLDLAGAPDRQLRTVLIAGTKGKGSTAAFLASLLAAAGVRVGLYSQPHLQVYHERIRVDGEVVASERFAAAVQRLRQRVARFRQELPEAGEPTTFELTTALAVELFAEAGCQIAVMEVGLGGRLDATNALAPELSLITPISYDHTEILGRTLRAIATEKAGILRADRPALLALQRPAAARALARCCRLVGARCRWVPPLAAAGAEAVQLPSGQVVRLSLAGTHQHQNAALALAAAEVLLGPALAEEAVVRGLTRLRWPGRFEVVAGEPPVVLDGAHNDASARALSEALQRYASDRPVLLVLGMSREKAAQAILRPLLPLASTIWVTAAHSPRALPTEQLAALCRRLTRVPVQQAPSVAAALEAARCVGRDAVVCVTGSLLVVGEARSALGLPPVWRLWEAGAEARWEEGDEKARHGIMP